MSAADARPAAAHERAVGCLLVTALLGGAALLGARALEPTSVLHIQLRIDHQHVALIVDGEPRIVARGK